MSGQYIKMTHFTQVITMHTVQNSCTLHDSLDNVSSLYQAFCTSRFKATVESFLR